jgi:catechol 2,3-dioxygenase-like lactoylglutathione lyase family enzyme
MVPFWRRARCHSVGGQRCWVQLNRMSVGRRGVKITALDHIVLCVADVAQTIAFYEKALGMQPREERPGKWSLHFGSNKISLQDARSAPEIARETVPGSANYCVLTDEPMDRVVEGLRELGIGIVAGPDEREGATGKILSVYFRDPDGNLVEVSNRLAPRDTS